MFLLFALILFITVSGTVAAQSGEAYVRKMYDRHHKNWYRTLSFTQETGFYRNDSLIRKSTWHERARFPHDLRIDVDSINGGTKIFYLKDSTYRVRNYKIQSAAVDPNPFVFFLGGIYMLPLDSSLATLTKNGYDLSLSSTTDWNGRKTLIIGAANDKELTRNQFWVDAEHLYITRVVVKMGSSMFDVHLSDHIKLSKAWSETNVKFYRDGRLLQVEKYSNLQPGVILSNDVFDVNRFR